MIGFRYCERDKIVDIRILENERWFGPEVAHALDYPMDVSSEVTIDLSLPDCVNQTQPLLLSTEGRYVYAHKGFRASFSQGMLSITDAHEEIDFSEGFGSLRGAFLAAAGKHFPANGVLPPEEFFVSPQFNTWIELIYNQNQTDILNYARTAVREGFKPGVLMIDDLWSNYYGKWDFDRAKFPDPKAMIDELHALGFKVILWLCPFVSLDSAEYRALSAKGAFVCTESGDPCRIGWWNGVSAMLDLSNPVDEQWLTDQTDRLIRAYGVDGFKFDAGEARRYTPDQKTARPVLPVEQTELWAKFGLKYPYNEYRACYACAGLPLVQRLCDKNHLWGRAGLAEVVPNSVMQGLLGYQYCCPDMVGGGYYADFLPGAAGFDPELFLRYTAASALLPMIQFSAAPWRVLCTEDYACVKALMAQREEYLPEIMDLVRQSAVTGESAVRHMEYVFPHEGLSDVKDQFMLGDTILVAPCIQKGKTEREVRLPAGAWKAEDGTLYEGGKTVTVPAPFDRVPVLRRI